MMMKRKHLWGNTHKIISVVFAALPVCSAAANVVVDGKITEQEWQGAQVFSNYVQSFPNTGEKPKYPTTTYLITDAEGIYVGFKNYQPQRSRKYSGHDQYTSADFNMVFIDFNNDGDTAYEFVATLGGGTMDGTYSRGNQSNRDWDGVWQVHVSEQDDYWFSEFFIPWTTATYREETAEKRNVSVYFQRQNVIDSQAYSFPDTHRGRKNFTYEFATVAVDNVKGQNFDYGLYSAAHYNVLTEQSESNIGLDITWKPKTNHQFIATVNPDFGTVESDELIVNYSAVETLRTDKRAFFTENQSLFDVQGPNSLQLVNTRRIGANAQQDASKIHDISYAGKYIYNGDLINAGILLAQEDDVVANDGKTFFSGRWYKSLDEMSFGQLVNYVDNPASDIQSIVVNHDGRYQLNDAVNLFANFIYSQRQSNQENNDITEVGKGATLKASYVPVRHWQNNVEWTYLDDTLDINAFGYQQRNDISTLLISSQYDDYQFAQSSPVLRARAYGEYNYQRNTQGTNLRDNAYASYFIRLKSGHNFRAGYRYHDAGFDDLITRQNGMIYRSSQQDFHLYYQSPTPANFSFNAMFNFYQEGEHDWANKLSINTRTYFSDTIRLDANYTYIDSDDWLVGNLDGEVKRYQRFMNKAYLKLVTRLSERSDLTLTTQWFGIKANGLESNDPQYLQGTDFNTSQFALQARYRYLFDNGSSLYFVYSHNGIDNTLAEQTGFRDLLSNAIANPNQKSVTAKLNWLF
ncbi:DUF5916 domain-containing protein [Thalassotalea ganghwensis]